MMVLCCPLPLALSSISIITTQDQMASHRVAGGARSFAAAAQILPRQPHGDHPTEHLPWHTFVLFFGEEF